MTADKELPELPEDENEGEKSKESGKGILSRMKKKKPSKDPKKRADEVEKELPKEKKKRKRLHRKSLQEYLDKAGFDAEAQRVRKVVFTSIIVIFLLGTFYMIWRAGCWGSAACSNVALWRTFAFFIALWTVVFLAVLLVAMGVVYFYLDYRIYKRTRELEEVLPDFLQLASANIAAGMPIDRALWYSIRPSFGILAKEMEEVAKATMSGESLEDSLIKFSNKYESNLLKRSMSILIEGLHSGGQLADLLNKIALNIDEIKIMKKEMAANVTTYAIFIMVAAVGIAPILFALATQLLTIITKITASLDLSSTQSFFAISAVSPEMIDNFKFYSYAMLIVAAGFGASIVSVIQKGRVMEGIKGIPVYALVAILLYWLGLKFFGGIFGGII